MGTNPTPSDDAKTRQEQKPRREQRSWKSAVKVVVPLVILIAVIFGIAFFSQYTSRDPEATVRKADEPPLRFTSSRRAWMPSWIRTKIDEERARGNEEAPSYPLQDVAFPGFFEPDSQGKATFWFENRNDSGVTLKLEKVSCSSCSEGAVYIVPPDTTRLTLQMQGVAVLPQGLLSGLPVGMVGPGALDRGRLPPVAAFPFADPSNVVFKIPAANDQDSWTPTWGILELGFHTNKPTEGRRLTAEFSSVVDNNPSQVGKDEFDLNFDVVEPIQMFPPTIDFGLLDGSSDPQPREFIVYSCTRDPKQFPPPSVLVRNPNGGDAGKFLTLGTPVPVPPAELEALAMTISEKLRRGQNVTAAYRVPVSLNLKQGNERLDIGLLERTIDASAAGIDVPTKAVHVKAVVRGGVWLVEGNVCDLGAFKASAGITTNKFELVTDRPDTVVKVAEGMQQPEFMQVTLDKQKDLGGKGLYNIRIHIPPGKQVGLIQNGVVVLEIQGPNPQRVRIPLKGRGDL